MPPLRRCPSKFRGCLRLPGTIFNEHITVRRAGVLTAGAYLTLRSILVALVWRDATVTAAPFLTEVLVTSPLLAVGALFDGTAQLVMWLVAAGVELATPIVFRRSLARTRFHPGHLPERFGLFVIIVLGEAIVAIGAPTATARQISIGSAAAVAVGFTLTAALGWVYFEFTAPIVQRALAAAQVQTDVVRTALTYAHLGLIAAIIAVASGVVTVIASPDQPLDLAPAGLLCAGCALYLATFTILRIRLSFPVGSQGLLRVALAGFGNLAALPLATHAPALIGFGTVTLILVTFTAFENGVINRTTSRM